MQDAVERRKAVNEVFVATGVQVDESDPIIVAALFQAYMTREAGQVAAAQMLAASEAVQAMANEAKAAAANAAATMRLVAAERKALGDAVEVRVKKAIREASHVQSSQEGPPTGWRGVLAGIAFGIILTGGLVGIACNFNRSLFSDARLGAEWRQAYPTLPPNLRDKLIEHFEKQYR